MLQHTTELNKSGYQGRYTVQLLPLYLEVIHSSNSDMLIKHTQQLFKNKMDWFIAVKKNNKAVKQS